LGPSSLATIVLVAKGDGLVIDEQEPMVRDRDAVGIAGEILEHVFGGWEGGPYEMGRLAVTLMSDRGFRHRNGFAVNRQTGEMAPTPTEEEFFRLAGLPCLPPARRNDPAAMIPNHRVPSRSR